MEEAIEPVGLAHWCVRYIRNNDMDNFRHSLKQLVQTRRSYTSALSALQQNMSAYCVLFDRPDFIAVCFKELDPEIYSLSYRVTFRKPCPNKGQLALARQLNLPNCERELDQHFQCAETKMETDINDAIEALLLLSYAIHEDRETFANCLKCLVDRADDTNVPIRFFAQNMNLNMNQHSPTRKKVLLVQAYIQTVKMIFDLGAEVNASLSGPAGVRQRYPCDYTVFSKICLQAWYYIQGQEWQVVALIRLFLYYNPSIALNNRVMVDILDIDCKIFRTLRKHFQELRLVPTFHKLGFPLTRSDLTNARGCVEFNRSVQDVMYKPRRLKDVCRASLRETYIGNRIHRYVEQVPLPKAIKDFLTLAEFNVTDSTVRTTHLTN